MSDAVFAVAFYAFSAVTILAALGVVLKKNIVHSALLLILAFVGVAGIYVLLQADFIAFVQILVYAGAVAILVAFGVMLTRRGDIRESNLFNKQKWPALFVVAGVFAVIYALLSQTNWGPLAAAGPEDSTGIIATLMLTDFVVPFETAAILLTVAMLGAIVIAKEVKNSK